MKKWTQLEHEQHVGHFYFKRDSVIPLVCRSENGPPTCGVVAPGWVLVDLDPRGLFDHQECIWEQLLAEAWGLA
jgi:hypothetical protein